MSRLKRILLSTVLSLVVFDASADVIPRLGDNIVRAALIGDESILQTLRVEPAIADLNLVSDDPEVRRFAVAWIQRISDPSASVGIEVLFAAIIDSRGDLIAGPTRIAEYNFGQFHPGNPSIAVDADGYFTISWAVFELDVKDGTYTQTIHARTFRPEANNGGLCPSDGLPVLLQDPLDPGSLLLDVQVVPELDGLLQRMMVRPDARNSMDSDSSANGRTVIVFPDHRAAPNWGVFSISTNLEIDELLPDPSVWCEVDHARLAPVDLLAPVTRIAGNGEFGVVPRVAINPNNEQAVVVWRSQAGAIEAQRLAPSGVLRGERIEVAAASSTQVTLHDPDVDYDRDGFFRVAWERNEYASVSNDIPANSQILMSRFDGAGNAVEEGLLVDLDNGSSFRQLRSLRSPRMQARDLDGDFAVSWSRQQDQCPNDIFGFSWSVAASSPCADGGSSGIDLPFASGRCTLTISSAANAEPPRCRAQMRLASFVGVNPGQIALAPDGQTSWDDFGPPRSATLEFGDADTRLDACRRLLHSDPFDARSRIIRQPCSGSNCISCEDQARAAGVSFDAPKSDALRENEATTPDRGSTSTRSGVLTDIDLRLRWFQRNFQTDDATPVQAVTVNDEPLTAGAPALAMSRSGDMLMGWIAEDVTNPDPKVGGNLNHALVTQNLTGPVELSINDVGILEGPLIRATGNFTLTANKPYPVRPGDCTGDTPRPTVSLLTADGSASFLSGDYTRTTDTLAFDPCDPLASLSLGFPVPVDDDGVFEDTESFFVDLFDEQNAIVVRRQGTGAIIDNDLPATVSGPAGVIEVCEDGTQPLAAAPRCPGTGTPRSDIEIGLTLDIAQEVEGSVEFLTMDGSAFGDIGAAEANRDYEPVSGELQFLPGTKEAFLSIELIVDQFAELPEQFFVELVGAENLTLPADTDDLQIRVNIIDDDVCATPPEWFLPDPNATVPETLPTHGTEAERSGYFCVVNPEGFDTCPWEARLDLAQGEEPWLGRTNIPFSAPPDGVTNAEVVAAQSACALISGATGAIRYLAEENLPDPADQTAPVQSRTQSVLFINGAAEPDVRDVTQAGGDCTPEITPSLQRFFPVGGAATFDVSFGDEPACEFAEWSAQVDSSAADWLSIDGASFDTGRFTFNGPGAFSIEVDPFTVDVGPVSDRIGVINVGDGVQVIQEAPLFDHFDDEMLPDPLGWQYLDPGAWSETGTHLTASAPGQARIVADPEFPGCSLCQLETAVRIDTFGKGQASVYMWWRDEGEHLRLVVDEFFDTWTLIQRVAGVDHELRVFSTDVLVGQEYPVRMEYRDDLGAPLITVDIDGQAMCPAPGPGLQPCTPWDPDPENDNVDPVIGSGTVGLGAAATTASFNLLRVIRADDLRLPLDGLFIDGFESVQ